MKLDLRDYSLTQDNINQLVEAIKQNTVIGNVYWSEIPKKSQSSIKKIEDKIEYNNINYQKYPTDYIHGLLAKHAYKNSKEGEAVEVLLEGKTEILPDWKVYQVFSDHEMSGYYGVIYK